MEPKKFLATNTKNSITDKNFIQERKSKFVIIFTAIVIAFALTSVIFISYAILITYTGISDKNISFVTTTTTILSIALAGFDTARACDNKGWLWGIFSGMIYAFVLLGIGACVAQKIIFSLETLMLFVLAIASGGLGGIIGINFKHF